MFSHGGSPQLFPKIPSGPFLPFHPPSWGGYGNPLQHSCLENPHGHRSLAGYSPWGRKESDTTEWLTHTHTHTSSSLGLRKVSTFVLSRQVIELLAASSVQVSLELWDFWAIHPLWNVMACGEWGKHPTLPFMGPALSQAFLIDGSSEHLGIGDSLSEPSGALSDSPSPPGDVCPH